MNNRVLTLESKSTSGSSIEQFLAGKAQLTAERLKQASVIVAEWTAKDVRQEVRRLIKSGGRNERSKNWRTSSPGEPPLSHTGTLKRSIRYERATSDDTEFVVGAPALGSSRLPRVLEEGGIGKRTTTTLSPSYFKRRFSRRKRTKNQKPYPTAARPYRVYSSDKPMGKIVREYLYFHSSSSWGRAKASADFQAWSRSVKTTSTLRFPVEPRPYIAPAQERQTSKERMEKRIQRALKASGLK